MNVFFVPACAVQCSKMSPNITLNSYTVQSLFDPSSTKTVVFTNCPVSSVGHGLIPGFWVQIPANLVEFLIVSNE